MQPTQEIHRPRLRVFRATVREVIWETHDTVTLLLDAGREPRDYLPGQFLSIEPGQFPALRQQLAYFEHTKGRRELARAYSLSSTPDEPYLAITVKEEPFLPGLTEYPPLLSPFLVHCAPPGLEMELKGFTGPYVLPPEVEERAEEIVHIVAGSGSVPNFSMLKWSLAHHARLRHTVLYSNKTRADIIFGRQLDELERRSGGRLRVLHCLTREQAPIEGVHLGRINLDLLRFVIPRPEGRLFYLCGPGITRWDKKAARARGEEPQPRFIERVTAMLSELGVPRAAVKYEAYG